MEPCKAMRSVNKAAVNWRGQLFLNTYDREKLWEPWECAISL